MKATEMIVELGADRAVRRVGAVSETNGARWNVTWPDGSQQTIQVGRSAPDGGSYVKAIAGSFQFDVLVRRAEIEALLETDPVEVFTLMLRSQAQARTARQLRETLEMSQFDTGVVKRAWDRARRGLEANDDVRCSGDGVKRTLRWVGTQRPAAPSPSETRSEPATSSVSALAEAADEHPVAAVEVADDDATTTAPDSSDAHERSSTSPRSASREIAVPDVLLQLARGQLDDIDAAGIVEKAGQMHASLGAIAAALTDREPGRYAVEASRDPLSTGVVLADLKEEIVAAAWERIAAPKNAFLLGVARRSKAVDAADPIELFGADVIGALVERAVAEVGRSSRGGQKDTRRAFGWFLDRVLHGDRASELGLDRLTLAAATGATRDEEQLERLVVTSAQVVDRAGAAGWAGLSETTRDRLVRSATLLPLTAKGARARLLVSVSRVAPSAISKAQWWQNVGADGLIDAAGGPLATVLDREDVASAVTRPAYESALDAASTRRRVMDLLAAPVSVARTASPSTVVAALARCAPSDAVLRSWMADLRDEAGRAELTSAADAMRSQRDAAVERARAARDRADQADAQVAKLTERLHAAADATGALRDSQTRQAQIDAVRALATVAAYVEKSVGQQDGDRVIAQVRGLAARQGLAPLGELDKVVAYEPDRHDLVVGTLDAGASVVVRAPGYTWRGPEGAIVLVHAVVEPVS